MTNNIYQPPGYNSYSGTDMTVLARLSNIQGSTSSEKVYSLGSLQTISISTHQDKKPIRAIGNMNAIDYTMGQRTIAGSLVFAVFDKHFAMDMMQDIKNITGQELPMSDELPPLDFSLVFANEYGRSSRMALYGVRLINEGQVMSVNDVFTENTYQFVATGLEPLNKGEIFGKKVEDRGRTVIDTTLEYEEDITEEQKEILDNFDPEVFPFLNSDITLSVSVEHPYNNKNIGIATFAVLPKQTKGIITIQNITNGNTEYIDLNDMFIGTALYKELFSGRYTAKYTLNNYESNKVNFTINSFFDSNILKNDYPIIRNITHNSIELINNNPTHNYINIQSLSDEYNENFIINKNNTTIKDLKANTEYVLKTFDSNKSNSIDYSLELKVKTLSFKHEYNYLFYSYVTFNKALLINDISNYEDILNEILVTDLPIIDYLLKLNKPESKELLLYAIKFTNQMTLVFNSNGIIDIPKKNQSYAFFESIKHNVEYDKANYYYIKNNKEYFKGSCVIPSEYFNEDISTRKYTTYEVSYENNNRSLNYDYCNFNDIDKQMLVQYKDTGNYDKLNIDSLELEHNKADNRLLRKIAAINILDSNKSMLYKPKVIFDDNAITVYLDVKDVLGLNKELYICISELETSLDYEPIRKIEYNSNSKYIKLDSYKTGISRNKEYVVWVEDINCNKITDVSYITSTNNKTDEVYINNHYIDLLIAGFKRELSKHLLKDDIYYKDLLLSIDSLELEPIKIYNQFELEMALISNNNTNCDIYLSKVINSKLNILNRFNRFDLLYNINKKILTFNNKDCYYVRVDINTNEESYRIITTEECEHEIGISKTKYSYYYAVNKNTLKLSNTLLINNKTNKLIYIGGE